MEKTHIVTAVLLFVNFAQSAVVAPVASLAPVTPLAPLPPVDDACLKCICMASTQCRPTACHNAGPTSYYCGPYLISWGYWADAGKPQQSPADPHAFEKCLTHKVCAEQTVRQYMAKFGQDCDSDGQVTCLDYARIHKAGKGECNAAWVDNTDYWKSFLQCFNANLQQPTIDVRQNVNQQPPTLDVRQNTGR